MDRDIAIHLLEQMVGKGIREIGRYVRENIKRDIVIVDDSSFKHYPRRMALQDKAVARLLEELPPIREDQYYYCKNSRRLVFVVEQAKRRLFLILKDIQTKQILEITDLIDNTRLALKNYLQNETRIEKQLQEEKRRFVEDLFVNRGSHIRFFREKMSLQLDMEHLYAVMVVAFDETVPAARLRQLSREFAEEDSATPIEPVFWQDMYIVILADLQPRPVVGREEFAADEQRIGRWKKFVEKKLGFRATVGIGNAYFLPDLYKSFDEARIAATFCLLGDQIHAVQKFEDMGIFTELFLHERRKICTFCRQTLDKLLEYDHDCDSDLQETLRALLTCNFNWKATAEKLFVHVNTLRYRYDKIEQLLGIDLANPDVRFNLYAAIRVGDVLKQLDLMQPAYIGNIFTHKVNRTGKKQSRTIF